MFEEDFKISDLKPTINFKDLLFKILNGWKFYLISLIICIFVAYQVNLRKQNIYRITTNMVVSSEKNPLFTSTTSLTFNWGGISDQIQTTTTLLESRTHAQKVVKYLQFYVAYKKEAKYWEYDAYKKAPFLIHVDSTRPQLINTPFVIEPIDEDFCFLTLDVPSKGLLQNYQTETLEKVSLKSQKIKKKIKYEEEVDLGFLKFTLNRYENSRYSFNKKPVTIRLIDFNSAVSNYRSINVKS